MRTQADRDDDLAIGRALERKDAEIERLRAALDNERANAEGLRQNCSRVVAENGRLRAQGIGFADWIERAYGNLPTDREPGPSTMLVQEMRKAFEQSKPQHHPDCQWQTNTGCECGATEARRALEQPAEPELNAVVVTDGMIDRALAAWFASPPSETDQGLERSMRAALEAALT